MKIKPAKILCFDIDNVICKTIGSNYSNSKSNSKVIKKINELYDKGFVIKIFTSRFMGRNKENINRAKKQGYKFTVQQLKFWGVKYHQLIFGKPSYDLFVDDKALFFKSNWYKQLDKYL
jgi:CMP-N,N'-diacetyllegionaminic acid synthase